MKTVLAPNAPWPVWDEPANKAPPTPEKPKRKYKQRACKPKVVKEKKPRANPRVFKAKPIELDYFKEAKEALLSGCARGPFGRKRT